MSNQDNLLSVNNTEKSSPTINIIDSNGIKTVSARELHQNLECSERFNSWFERMLKYGFQENVDFTSVKVLTEVQNNGGIQKRELDEYFISLDMAKEICMLQRSEKGRQFRQYFIEVEKTFKNAVQTGAVKIETGMTEYQFRIEVYDRLHALAEEYEGKSKTYKQILDAHATKQLTGEFLLPLPATQKTFSAEDVAKELGISAVKVGRIANHYGLKTDEYGCWQKDKSKYADKEVDAFRYYENAIPVIAEHKDEVIPREKKVEKPSNQSENDLFNQ